jgi:hypothetical protein
LKKTQKQTNPKYGSKANQRSIRNISDENYRKAKSQAALSGIEVGEWINLAIIEKLERVK